MSARDRGQISEGGVIAVACIIVFDIGAVLTGVAGRVLFPGLGDPETVLPVMSTELFPAIVAGVILVVVLAAIMSTVDSLLILASSAVVRDTVQKVFRPDFSDRRLALIGRGLTVVIGLGGLAVALPESRMIFWFVLFAWSGLASAFTPVVLCSLFWRGTTRAGALAGMIAGFLTAVLWVLWVKEHFYDLYEMIPGFAVGFARDDRRKSEDEAPRRGGRRDGRCEAGRGRTLHAGSLQRLTRARWDAGDGRRSGEAPGRARARSGEAPRGKARRRAPTRRRAQARRVRWNDAADCSDRSAIWPRWPPSSSSSGFS